jgi:hypothetical protein
MDESWMGRSVRWENPFSSKLDAGSPPTFNGTSTTAAIAARVA